jgi:seryl-tRNA synthetase
MEAFSKQIAALSQKVDSISTNLVRVEGSINFTVEAEANGLSKKISKQSDAGANQITALATELENERNSVSDLSDALAAVKKSVEEIQLHASYISQSILPLQNQIHDIAVEQIDQGRSLDHIKIKLNAY